MADSLVKDTSVAVKRGIDSSRWFAYGTGVIGWSEGVPVKATFVICCCPPVTKSNPLFPEFSFKTGGNFIVGSPHWKHSELFFEKKALIPALQQLLASLG